MSDLQPADYFRIGIESARSQARRESITYREYEPAVRVTLTVLGPDNQTRVPCGEATFPRCHADVFERGILTLTNRDDDSIVREYPPDQWTTAVCYGYHGDIDYVLTPQGKR